MISGGDGHPKLQTCKPSTGLQKKGLDKNIYGLSGFGDVRVARLEHGRAFSNAEAVELFCSLLGCFQPKP